MVLLHRKKTLLFQFRKQCSWTISIDAEALVSKSRFNPHLKNIYTCEYRWEFCSLCDILHILANIFAL